MASQRAVQVIHLGRMGFLQAWDIQLRYARQHQQYLSGLRVPVSRDVLLIVEHHPVYTVGQHWPHTDQPGENDLKQLGAQFYRTNRHGLMTFHGPGQLVAYPILNLRHFQPDMKHYIGSLHHTLIDTCRRMGVEDCTVQDQGYGVWMKDKLIGTVGANECQLITTHGLSLNCDIDLSWFHAVKPAEAEVQDVTSLTQELNTPIPIRKVLSPFLAAFGQVFQCEMELNMLDAQDASLLKEGEEMEVEDVMKAKSFSAAQPARSSSRPGVSMW